MLMKRRVLSILFFTLTISSALSQKIVEAETANIIGGSKKISDNFASGSYLAGLNKSGDGLLFSHLQAARKLAIRYATVNTGTISIAVNNQKAIKINIHSSGALTGSFLHAITDVAIPAGAILKIYLDSSDVALNIDQIVIGNDDLGLAPDIWNLPPLTIADGPFSADWKALSRIYVVPEWWRDAKFGAWAHWDPQSMPEQGDWYARNMYIERNPVYAFHNRTFGHPSEYGYNDIAHNCVIDRWHPEELMTLSVEMG